MNYAEMMLQRAVQAINSDVGVEHDWSDLETYDFSDPVALITESQDREPLEQIAGLDYSEFERNFTPAQGRARGRHQEVSQIAQQGPVDPIIDVPNYASLTTESFVKKALAKRGLDYVWGGESRAEGGFDCSGLIVNILRNNGFANFERMTSGTLIEHANPMSLKKAIKTRGALLWAEGHIAISLGNGKTIEAANSQDDITIGTAHGRFTRGGMLPELVQSLPSEKRRPRRPAKGPKRPPSDPLNRIESVSSLTAAPMVFGTIMAEVNERPTTKRGWDNFAKEPGLGFVPANRRGIFKAAAEKYGISARLLASMGVQESGLRHITTPNSAGAVGPLQVIPRWHPQFDASKLAQNYRYNVMAGAAIFASYLEKAGGNLRLALAFYNAGPNADRDVLERVMVDYSDPILERFRGKAA